MAFMRRTTLICLLITVIIVFGGCTRGENTNQGNFGVSGGKGPKKVGVVLSAPGQSEAGLNEIVVAGVKRAAADLDARYMILAQKDLVNDEESLRYLAENDYDMVVAIGRGIQDDLNKVAPDYPDIKFAIFDGEVDRPNVASVRINLDDGAFLAGVATASLTKSNIVGFVGGSMDSGRQMETAFARGVQYINSVEGKTVKINSIYAGVTEAASNDPERGKTLANNLYWTGSDVVFGGAGKLGSGVAAAAAENRKIAIGADLQLMNASPWIVWGALVKKQEIVVYEMTTKVLTGKFQGGRIGFGLADGAVDFITSEAVPADIKAKVTAIKDGVKKGQIKPYAVQLPQGLVTQISVMPVDMNKALGTPSQSPGSSVKPKSPGSSTPPGNTTPPGNQTTPGGTTPPGTTTPPGITTPPGTTTPPGDTTPPDNTTSPGTTTPPPAPST